MEIPAPASASVGTTTYTRIQNPRYLNLSRAIWLLLAGVGLLFMLISIPARYDELQTVYTSGLRGQHQLVLEEAELLAQSGISLQVYAAYALAFQLITAASFIAVGGLMFWRRSDDWMVLLTSLMLVLYGVINPAPKFSGTILHDFLVDFSAALSIFILLYLPQWPF